MNNSISDVVLSGYTQTSPLAPHVDGLETSKIKLCGGPCFGRIGKIKAEYSRSLVGSERWFRRQV